jgi:hypothetical protein
MDRGMNNEGNPGFIPEWDDWKELFCEIKYIGSPTLISSLSIPSGHIFHRSSSALYGNSTKLKIRGR